MAGRARRTRRCTSRTPTSRRSRTARPRSRPTARRSRRRRARPRRRRAVPPREVRRRRASHPAELASDALLSASSPASTCATARSSRASTSRACARPAIRRRWPPATTAKGIDEIVILDVTATLEARQARAQTIRAVAREIFLPLCVGGGIRSEDDAAAAIEAGADKVSLNTRGARGPVAHHAARRALRQPGGHRRHRRQAQRRRASRSTRAAARDQTPRDAVEWAREAAERGAGEILLTSIDRDGTKSGFDCELTAAVSDAVPIPVIASGGAGTFEHFADVFTAGRADAALAASIFHFNEKSVSELKAFLTAHGIPVRVR